MQKGSSEPALTGTGSPGSCERRVGGVRVCLCVFGGGLDIFSDSPGRVRRDTIRLATMSIPINVHFWSYFQWNVTEEKNAVSFLFHREAFRMVCTPTSPDRRLSGCGVTGRPARSLTRSLSGPSALSWASALIPQQTKQSHRR